VKTTTDWCIRHLVRDAHYGSLALVKHTYDPTNMFRQNQNIAIVAM